MPFHIDRFKGSPAVQAMHPAARMGYLYLLSCQWQSDECSLPSDPIDLAELSGLGDELWAQYGARIMRNFDALEDGRFRNSVCFEEWQESKAIFDHNQEVRSAAGKKGNEKRWGNRKCDKKDRKCDTYATKSVANESQNIATGTVTGTLRTSRSTSSLAFCVLGSNRT
jgi:uncharacterized protein YdaU (DUF1376 family)